MKKKKLCVELAKDFIVKHMYSAPELPWILIWYFLTFIFLSFSDTHLQLCI